jgi:hypothetical protein
MAEKKFIYSTRKPIVVVWPALIAPRAYVDEKTKKEGQPMYSGRFCFTPDHPEIKALKGVAIDCLRNKWDDGELKDFKWPWMTGDQAADRRKANGKPSEFFRNYALVLPAKSKYMTLGVIENGGIVDVKSEIEKKRHEEKFYSGVECVAEFSFKPFSMIAMDGSTIRGLTAYVNMVASFNRGERIGGGKSASETFKDVVGHDTTDDPTTGDDEI